MTSYMDIFSCGYTKTILINGHQYNKFYDAGQRSSVADIASYSMIE